MSQIHDTKKNEGSLNGTVNQYQSMWDHLSVFIKNHEETGESNHSCPFCVRMSVVLMSYTQKTALWI